MITSLLATLNMVFFLVLVVVHLKSRDVRKAQIVEIRQLLTEQESMLKRLAVQSMQIRQERPDGTQLLMTTYVPTSRSGSKPCLPYYYNRYEALYQLHRIRTRLLHVDLLKQDRHRLARSHFLLNATIQSDSDNLRLLPVSDLEALPDESNEPLDCNFYILNDYEESSSNYPDRIRLSERSEEIDIGLTQHKNPAIYHLS